MAVHVERLLDPANIGLLQKVLTYHVIPGEVRAADLVDGAQVGTVEGNTVTIDLDGGAKVNGANIIATDIEVENGVIHLIDGVLLESLGMLQDIPTIDLVYKLGSAPVDAGDGVAQTFSPSWTNGQAVVTFSTPITGLMPTGSENVFVRAFHPQDQVAANDVNNDMHEVFIEKVHGFENFDAFETPFFSYADGLLDLPWTIVDNNGGDRVETVVKAAMNSGKRAICAVSWLGMWPRRPIQAASSPWRTWPVRASDSTAGRSFTPDRSMDSK